MTVVGRNSEGISTHFVWACSWGNFLGEHRIATGLWIRPGRKEICWTVFNSRLKGFRMGGRNREISSRGELPAVLAPGERLRMASKQNFQLPVMPRVDWTSRDFIQKPKGGEKR